MRFSPSTQCFYPDDVTYPDLPTDVMDVTIDEFHAALNRSPGSPLSIVDGNLVIGSPPELTIDDVTADKLAEIESAYNAAIYNITSAYPESERNTWHIQEAEAKAYADDPSAAVPFLSALAQVRNISVADLAAAVLVKAAAFKAEAAAAIGRRRVAIDALEAIDKTKKTAINKIKNVAY